MKTGAAVNEKQIKSISLQAMLNQGVFRSIDNAQEEREYLEELCYKKKEEMELPRSDKFGIYLQIELAKIQIALIKRWLAGVDINELDNVSDRKRKWTI